jgi:glycosyltransferase involved in cell wall biosynthesis
VAQAERQFRDEPDGAVVSVIIPTYNSAAVVPAAVRSVLAQTRPADEIIVVDDAGSDDTAIACAAFGDAVRYLRRGVNGGASSARNTGIDAARGDWLAFLDADDLWRPRKLELQLAALAQNPAADFALTGVRVWSPGDESYRRYAWAGSLHPDDLRAELLVRNIFTGLCSSILIRRAALAAVGGFASGKACEDRRLGVELFARCQAVILDEPLVRQRPGPAHWRDPERHRREMLSFIADYTDLYERLDSTGRLRRRAVARMHERTGMHYVENGDLRAAARDLFRAVRLQPLLPNPWRVLANACLGRLNRKSRGLREPAALAAGCPPPE